MLRLDTDYAYRGMDLAVLENDRLRVEVLTGKGGDVREIRDKRTDANVLWERPGTWTPPPENDVPAGGSTWEDHYPGGWQVNLPVAGDPRDIGGSAYGLHGESALLPTDVATERGDGAVTLRLAVDLVRYPFRVERALTLRAGESRLRVSEAVTNEAPIDLEYEWQHHVALGAPLVGPNATLAVPDCRGVVGDYGPEKPNNRLAGGATFEWPDAPGADGGTVDLSALPPADRPVSDTVYLDGLDAGEYALVNPEADLGFALDYPTDPFAHLWYWQPLGGEEKSPFFGRPYAVGLEPTTTRPGAPADDVLAAGESRTVELTAATFPSDADPADALDGSI